MKTVANTLVALAAVVLVAGCAAGAADTEQTWTPGWRHEQMVKALQDGKAVPRPMMMRGPGFGPGSGRGPAALTADGRIDPAALPPWCPLNRGKAETK